MQTSTFLGTPPGMGDYPVPLALGAIVYLPLEVGDGLVNKGSLGGTGVALNAPVQQDPNGYAFVAAASQAIRYGALPAMPAQWTAACKATRTAGARVMSVYGSIGGTNGIAVNVGATFQLIYEGVAVGTAGAAVDASPHSFIVTYDAGSSVLYVDGVAGSTLTNVPIASDQLVLAQSAGNYMSGIGKAPMLFDRVLSAPEIARLAAGERDAGSGRWTTWSWTCARSARSATARRTTRPPSPRRSPPP